MRLFVISFILFIFSKPAFENSTSYKITLPFKPKYKIVSDQANALCIVSKSLEFYVISLPSDSLLLKVDCANAGNAAISPDGRWLAIVKMDHHVTVYSTKSSKTITWEVNVRPGFMSFINDKILQINNTIWDINKTKFIKKLKTDFGPINGIKTNTDGSAIIAGGGDTIVRFYETGSWKLKWEYTGLMLEPFGFSFIRNGLKLAVGGVDDRIDILDSTTGKLVRTLHTGYKGIHKILSVGDKNWMAVEYFDELTNKQEGWRLVNINSGKSRKLCDANTLVGFSGDNLWCLHFNDNKLTVKPVAIPSE